MDEKESQKWPHQLVQHATKRKTYTIFLFEQQKQNSMHMFWPRPVSPGFDPLLPFPLLVGLNLGFDPLFAAQDPPRCSSIVSLPCIVTPFVCFGGG